MSAKRPPPEFPAIRPLELQQVDRGQQHGVVLLDRLGISEPTFVPQELLPIVGRCTGQWSLAAIQQQASAQLGEAVPRTFVEDLVVQLDERLLLLGERFDAAVARAAEVFLDGGVRPPSHAGSAGCPSDPARPTHRSPGAGHRRRSRACRRS